MKTKRVNMKKQKLKRWQKVILGIVTAIVILVALCILTFLVMRVIGKNRLKSQGSVPVLETEGVETEEDWKDGWIRYNGDIYAYNEDIMTFLILGIDSDEAVQKVEDGMSGGQSDAMFLAVLNPRDKSVSIISINRNAMAAVDVYDEDGIYMGQYTKQITLQHGYGDGKELSCERAVAAVSRLFYNLPIKGYCSINMGAIPVLNDAVGGVEVTVLDDVIYPEFNVDLPEGKNLTLDGHQAYWYVRGRNENVFGSSGKRLARQQQYIVEFLTKAKEEFKTDLTLPINLYNILSKYMVTDIGVTEVSYLATEAVGYDFGGGSIYSMEGKTIMGDKFEEFYADEEKLYQLVIDIFYEKVEQ